MNARSVFYRGRVQGVGFRATVARIAGDFKVTGWVRNLPDGRVELGVRAEPDEMRSFLEAIRSSHLGGYIAEESSRPCEEDLPSQGFEVRF